MLVDINIFSPKVMKFWIGNKIITNGWIMVDESRCSAMGFDNEFSNSVKDFGDNYGLESKNISAVTV